MDSHEKAERVDLSTPDLAAASRAAFQQLFPGVLADGVLDAVHLGELLDTPVTAPAEGRERFGLMWAGKQEAIRSLLTPSRGTLVPQLDKSVDFDTAQNVFIEGDNLDVLKLLQKAYNDKVKLIYIDPPYNTGNDFVYNDDFSDGLRGYLEYTGQIDEEGNRTSANANTSGRRHSKWLSMMYPRLVLARNLLRQDGVLAVSIDDNEAANLQSVLNEVFGPENFVNVMVWVSNLKGRQISGTGAARTKEYILIYARDIKELDSFRSSATLLKSWMPAVYKGFNYEIQSDERGPFVLKNELHNTNSRFNEVTRPNLVFDIYYDPHTGLVKTADLSDQHRFPSYVKIAPKKNNNGTNKYHAFRWSRAKVKAETYNLAFVPSGTGYKVFTKVRDVDSTAVKDLIMDITTNEGATDLVAVGIEKRWFDYPKPVKLVQLLCAFASDRESLILDFFAGSGTTAHAVALQNAADGGQRRHILINLPEATAPDSAARAAGLATVSEICHRRLLGVLGKIDGANPLGLRTFALGVSSFGHGSGTDDALFDLSETTLLSASPDFDVIAAEVLLKEGVTLDAPWERTLADGALIVVSSGVAVVLSLELNDDVVEAALDLKPRVLVFMEDGFASKDAVKADAFTRARNLGITMKTV
jgi:adenine-specific DNA-methyltransferase